MTSRSTRARRDGAENAYFGADEKDCEVCNPYKDPALRSAFEQGFTEQTRNIHADHEASQSEDFELSVKVDAAMSELTEANFTPNQLEELSNAFKALLRGTPG